MPRPFTPGAVDRLAALVGELVVALRAGRPASRLRALSLGRISTTAAARSRRSARTSTGELTPRRACAVRRARHGGAGRGHRREPGALGRLPPLAAEHAGDARAHLVEGRRPGDDPERRRLPRPSPKPRRAAAGLAQLGRSPPDRRRVPDGLHARCSDRSRPRLPRFARWPASRPVWAGIGATACRRRRRSRTSRPPGGSAPTASCSSPTTVWSGRRTGATTSPRSAAPRSRPEARRAAMVLGWLDYVVIAGYLVAIIAFGSWFARVPGHARTTS